MAKWSAGLRIRVHPLLQSEQLGVIKPQGVISFIDEVRHFFSQSHYLLRDYRYIVCVCVRQVHNSDGVWLRLSQDSMLEWCQTSNHREAWALQYNQHLGKTLLVAVDQPKPSLDLATDDSSFQSPETGKSRTSACTPSAGGPGQYTVVNRGASGHNIRSGCTLKSSPVGVLHLSAIVTAVDDVMNEDGTWIRLDEESREQFCDDPDGDCWALVRDEDGVSYLEHEATDVSNIGSTPSASAPAASGFDFSAASRRVPDTSFSVFAQELGR